MYVLKPMVSGIIPITEKRLYVVHSIMERHIYGGVSFERYLLVCMGSPILFKTILNVALSKYGGSIVYNFIHNTIGLLPTHSIASYRNILFCLQYTGLDLDTVYPEYPKSIMGIVKDNLSKELFKEL